MISRIINDLKGVSASWVNKNNIVGTFPGWQDGYAAISVSPENVQRTIKYIKNQDLYHKGAGVHACVRRGNVPADDGIHACARRGIGSCGKDRSAGQGRVVEDVAARFHAVFSFQFDGLGGQDGRESEFSTNFINGRVQ